MSTKKKGLRLPFIPTAVFLFLLGVFVLKNSLFSINKQVLGISESQSKSEFENSISGLDGEIEDVDLGMSEIEKDLQSFDQKEVSTNAEDDMYLEEDLEMPEVEEEMSEFSEELESEDVEMVDLLETGSGNDDLVELVKEGSGLRDIKEEAIDMDGSKVVVIEGLVDKKLFGIVPIAITERMSISAETGEVLSVDRSFWSMLMNFWSR